MELQHLRYFLDIAYEESISKAAERNHIAQPAMSRTLAVLEKELGVKLFDRVGRNIKLNECGRILMEAAEQSISILDAVPERIHYYSSQLTGSIKVCLCAPIFHFGELCEDFRKEYPLVKLDIQNMANGKNVHLNSQYDLFIYMGPVKYEGSYAAQKLHSHRLVAMMRPENPLSQRETLCFSQLSNQELVIPRFTALRDIIYSYCYQSGFVPQIAGEVSLPSGQKLLLDTSPENRTVLLLREVDGKGDEGYVTRPFSDLPKGVDISLAWSESAPLRPSVHVFRDYILEFYKMHQQ